MLVISRNMKTKCSLLVVVTMGDQTFENTIPQTKNKTKQNKQQYVFNVKKEFRKNADDVCVYSDTAFYDFIL